MRRDTEVLPISNSDRLGPVIDGKMQIKCRQFVSEFVGDDCVEERPDVRAFIFPVGEGLVENNNNSI